jgi:hypothetical protein
MKKSLAIVAIAIALTACDNPVPHPIQQAMPQTEQQAPAAQQQSGISPLGAGLAGAAGGYLLGKMAGRNQAAQQAPTVVHQYHPPAPSYSNPGYSPSNRTTTTTTTVKRSMFGNKTVTRTVTRRR